MSTVSTSIQLHDRVSATIGNIVSAIENVCSAFDSVEQSMDGGFNSSAIDSARAALSSAVVEADRLGDEIEQNANNQNKFTEEVEDSQASMDGLVKKAMGLAGAFFSVREVFGFVSNAMEGSNLESSIQAQLKNVLRNTGAVEGAFEDLKEAADSFEENGMFGGAEMLAGAGELATYISDPEAIKSMMGTLADYATGMSGGGALNSDQIVEYGTQLGKALMGTYDGLKKKGFELTDVQKKIIDGTATQAETAMALGVTMEEVANMSADMQSAMVLDSVIGESWDGLYESMSNTPEGKVASLNNAWGDVMDSIGHQLTPYVMHLYDIIMENMPHIKNLMLNITESLGSVIAFVGLLTNAIGKVGGFVADNWEIISPIIGGAIAMLSVYLIVTKGVELATKAWAAAQAFFNGVMALNPVYLIIMGVILLISLIYSIIGAINKLTGKSISATGVIVGALMTAVAFIWNLFVGLVELVSGVVNFFYNKFVAFANFFANVFKDPIGSIIHLFGDMADRVLGVIESVAKAIDAVFGSNLASSVSGWRTSLDGWIEDKAAKYGNGKYEEVVEKLELDASSFGMSRWAYGDAYKTGYEWGANFGKSPEENLLEGINDKLGGISDSAEETASNTKGLSDTQEDLAYLRDIAERDIINRYTTSEIKIEQTNHNSIASDMDIDGIMSKWNADFIEILETAAEGVHA